MLEKKKYVKSKITNVLRNILVTHTPMYSKVYGKVYCPIYELRNKIAGSTPEEEYEIYNKDGQRMRQFFIRDAHINFNYTTHHQSKYFIWDFYNFALSTHFYSHHAMLQQMGSPERKYGFLIESEIIKKRDYDIFNRHKGLEKDFNYIFTFSEKILNSVDNARFFPAFASSWYKGSDDKIYEKKTKNISILSSDKAMTDLHKLRLALALKYKDSDKVDTYGTFAHGWCNILDTLKEYRYTFAIENDRKPYYFTERLTSSFRTMTVPIYIGATKIQNFFNPDGMIIIKPEDYDNIDKIIAQCCEKDYEQRLPAIIDNYHRAEKYVNVWDTLFEDYIKE